jgi:hypothetical protein
VSAGREQTALLAWISKVQTFAAGTAARIAAIVTRSGRESAFIFRIRKSFHGRDKVTVSLDYQTGDHGFRGMGLPVRNVGLPTLQAG